MSTRTLYEEFGDFLAEIRQEKSAAVKQAGDPPTEHPTGKADNGTQSVPEGSPGGQYDSTLKEQQGAPGVNSNNAAPPTQDSLQPNQGTTQSATGEDGSTEDRYKGDYKDPGTDHPASSDNKEKYAAAQARYATMEFDALYKEAGALADEILAEIAVGVTGPAPAPKQAPKQAQAQTPAPAKPAPAAKQASADPEVEAFYLQTVRDAHRAADALVSYLHSRDASLAKQAQAPAQAPPARPAQPAKRANDMGMAGAGPADMAAMAGPGGPGGMPAPADGGAGAPPAPPGGEGGGGGGGPGGPVDPAAVEQLIMALEEQGISVEELLAALGGGHAGGGAPPSGGDAAAVMGGGGGDGGDSGAPPSGGDGDGDEPPPDEKSAAARMTKAAREMPPEHRAGLVKLARAAAPVRKQPGWKYRGSKDAQERALRVEVGNALRDIVGR